jgi:hypothetical protein
MSDLTYSVTITGLVVIAIILTVNIVHKTVSQPTCTAYQAIDGKPVCIEFQLTTNN